MEIIKKIKSFLNKALAIGTPPKKEVLYDEVTQREVPKESAEKIVIRETIETVKDAWEEGKTKVMNIISPEEDNKETIADKVPPEKKPTPKKAAANKAVAKKPAVKKPAVKKPAIKKPTVKKAATSKKAEKIALYTKDITKHYGEVDEEFLAIIVKNLGPSIYKKDAELVSCSDPKELDTVRKNFLIKKLGIEASQSVLDAAIQDVCEELKPARNKYRATFYYSLAKKFKKESVLN